MVAATAAAQSAPIVPADRIVTSYTLPPEKLAKATALYAIHVRLYLLEGIYGFALLLVFLYGKVGPKYRDVAERGTDRKWAQAFIFVPLLYLTLQVLQVPTDVYRHHLQLAYGLSVQTWASWFGDVGKATAIQTVVATLAVALAYIIMRWSPRRWWLWFWCISIPIIVFMVFIAPEVIDPIFNKFDPLQKRQPQLVTEIGKVVEHGGLSIPPERMFEMRASEKVTTLNAYVTGLGASKRVVVWDNTSRLMTTPQTLYVFGHEMGHYVLQHVWRGIAFTIVMLLIALWLAARVGEWMVRRWGQRWGIRALSDYASLPVLLLIAAVLSFVTSPVTSAFSRSMERAADKYGVEVVHGIVPNAQQACAQSFQALGENGLSYPYPNRLLVFWTASHPTIGERVRFCNEYDPWAKGESPKYVK